MSSADDHRNGPDDEEVARAFAALGRTIRDGHLDGFASKVLARLDAGEEVTDMDARRDAGRGSGQNKDIGLMTMTPAGRESGSQRHDSEELVTERTPRMDAAELEQASPLPGDATVISPKPREENSGLHEIQALAKSAKKRMSQRMTSQSESEESLLKEATSSGSFRAVALPDPTLQTSPPQLARPSESAEPAKAPTKRSAQVAAVASAVDTEESAAAASFQPRLLEQPKGPPFWLLGGVAVVAAAALVAVFVFDVGRSSKSGDGQVASAPTSESAAPVADQAGSAEQSAAVASAPVAEPLAEATEPEGGEGAAGSAEMVAAADPADEEPDATGDSSEREDSDRAERRAARASAADKGKGEESARRGEKEAKQPSGKATTGSKSNKSPAIGVSSGAGGEQDLESVLDSVTGGVESIKDAKDDKPAKPKKKELDRRDVSSAMDKIRGSAIRCGEVEGYTSSVSVKFVVEPSGKVSSARVVGAKSGTMTGDCVVSAVKRAKFPPFDGTPTTFTFPFLLAE